MMPAMDQPTRGAVQVLLRITAGGAVVVGLGMVLIAIAVGDCSAFGGRCPAEPTPLLEDDAFGTAAFGTFMATAAPIFATAPSRRRLGAALAIGAAAAIVVGLVARSITSS
jgi:hypothetical protein